MNDIIIPIKCKTMKNLNEKLKRINATLLIIATLISWGILLPLVAFRTLFIIKPEFTILVVCVWMIGTVMCIVPVHGDGDASYVIYNLSYFPKLLKEIHLPKPPKIRCKGDDEE